MNKKLLAMGLSVTMIAGMLTGCGSSSTESGDSTASTSQTQSEVTEQNTASEISQTAASDDEPITLRFAWWGGDERNAATLEVIEQFEALHPNVTIEAEYGGNDGYHDKLATQLASGTAADIVQVDPETFPQYVSTGDYFVNYMDYSNMDLSTFDENYISLEINRNSTAGKCQRGIVSSMSYSSSPICTTTRGFKMPSIALAVSSSKSTETTVALGSYSSIASITSDRISIFATGIGLSICAHVRPKSRSNGTEPLRVLRIVRMFCRISRTSSDGAKST